MLYSVKHKKIIAFLLMAVYCLVAVPAAALHSHGKNDDGRNNVSSKRVPGENTSITTDTGTDGVCKICAHQFQIHSDDSFTPIVTIINFTIAENGFLNCLIPQLPRHSNFNKGPPALI